MHRWLRLLVIWFAALALPVQGIAGAAMTHCGQSHERMHASRSDSQHHHAAHASPAGHDHGHDHVGATAHDADPAATGLDDGSSHDKVTQLGKYKCSSCASCCSGAALPSSMPALGEPTITYALFAAEVIGVDAFASGGPDRPPRIDLA